MSQCISAHSLISESPARWTGKVINLVGVRQMSKICHGDVPYSCAKSWIKRPETEESAKVCQPFIAGTAHISSMSRGVHSEK